MFSSVQLPLLQLYNSVVVAIHLVAENDFVFYCTTTATATLHCIATTATLHCLAAAALTNHNLLQETILLSIA